MSGDKKYNRCFDFDSFSGERQMKKINEDLTLNRFLVVDFAHSPPPSPFHAAAAAGARKTRRVVSRATKTAHGPCRGVQTNVRPIVRPNREQRRASGRIREWPDEVVEW